MTTHSDLTYGFPWLRNIIFFLLMTAVSIYCWLVLTVLDVWDLRHGAFLEVVSLPTAILFGMVAAYQFYMLWRYRDHVLSVGPSGIHDLRITKTPIPWTAIDRIRAVNIPKHRYLILALKEELPTQEFVMQRNILGVLTGPVKPSRRSALGHNLRRSVDGIASDIANCSYKPQNIPVEGARS